MCVQTVASVIIPCALRLCRDPVFAVRAAAATSTAAMMVAVHGLAAEVCLWLSGHVCPAGSFQHFSPSQEGRVDASEVAVFLWQNVRQLAASSTYTERQVFVWVCGGVVTHQYGTCHLPCDSAHSPLAQLRSRWWRLCCLR